MKLGEIIKYTTEQKILKTIGTKMKPPRGEDYIENNWGDKNLVIMNAYSNIIFRFTTKLDNIFNQIKKDIK